MAHREDPRDLLARDPRGRDGRRRHAAWLEAAQRRGGRRDRRRRDHRRRPVVELPAIPKRHPGTARKARRPRARREHARRKDPDVLQRVRDLRDAALPLEGCSGEPGRVPPGEPANPRQRHPDQGGVGQHRLVRVDDTRAVPLARAAGQPHREPSAVDLQAGLSRALLPAVAAAHPPDPPCAQPLPAR